MLLTRLGIARLWGEDAERLWRAMRWFVPPPMMLLAPSSTAYGAERVPMVGGAVLAANHLSALDPPLIGIFSPRAIHYMCKAELLAVPVVGDVLHWTGAFPVRRGEADREALRTARDLVRTGQLVGVFVEGTRQRLGYPGPVHPGAGMIAMQEGVPVIPCGLDSFGWSLASRRACAVVWGEPISLDGLPHSGKGYREAAEIIRAELERLWRQAAEAVAARLPPALPDGTRRTGWIRPGYDEPPPRSLEPVQPVVGGRAGG